LYKFSGPGLHVVSAGTGSNLHVIANIDYGFMLESIREDEESPRRKRKKKNRKKLSGVWSAETRLDESGNKIYSEEEDRDEHLLESTSSASESSQVSL
jgi:hypothetical protein